MLHRTGWIDRLRTPRGRKRSEMEGPMTSLKIIAEKWNAWRRFREAVRELEQLSDRDLADIGIRRCDIYYVVSGELPR
jgi:uncharacterized protein YjiS (DUF1127 family)